MSLLARSRPRLRDEAPGRRRWRPSAPPTSRRQQSDLETRVCRQTSLIVITAYRCAGGNQLCQKFSISLLALSSHAIRDLETFVTLRSELPEAGVGRPRHASQTQHQRMTTPHSRTYGIYGGRSWPGHPERSRVASFAVIAHRGKAAARARGAMSVDRGRRHRARLSARQPGRDRRVRGWSCSGPMVRRWLRERHPAGVPHRIV